ncbi:transposase [Pantoea sp. ME81]|uniref:transposase n=1 Tax=Pantoea sp. ME81 TaxID=2743935 RepID=UPI0021055E63|nr:transposase [Pantoea sp. ME81]
MSGFLASTAAAVGIIDKAVGIAKKLSDDGAELDKATLKLELANLMGELASVKLEVISTQALLFDAETKNKDLEKKLNEKKSFSFHDGLYWKDGDKVAFCPKCYEGNQKSVHMRLDFTQAEPEYGISLRRYWYCYHCHFEHNLTSE